MPDTQRATQLLTFTLDEPTFALDLSVVERVVRAVAVTSLPQAPKSVLGVIDVHGTVVPVADIRRCLGLPARSVRADDRIVLARTSRRLVALVVDSVEGVQEPAGTDITTAGEVLPGSASVHGLAKLKDGLALICDLDQLLALDEEQELDAALADSRKRSAS